MDNYVVGYKWTTPKGFSWHDGKFGPWKVGKSYEVPEAVAGEPCGPGIHIGKTATAAISYGKFPGRLFSVKATSLVLGSDDTKWRVKSVRVVKELKKPKWVCDTEAFLESIKTVKFFKPKQKPLKKWKHFHAGAAAVAAAGAAAGDAAGDAAWAAAGDAAWAAAGAAAWDAARAAAGAAAVAAAWAAAGDAAGAAAVAAAWAAAGDAARDAAWDAARAACLMVRFAIVSDLKFKDVAKHRKHARDRWKVWQMGYGLLSDVNGVFYTYDNI